MSVFLLPGLLQAKSSDWVESFCYDDLSRLRYAGDAGNVCASDFSYDSLGNIKYKKGISYDYRVNPNQLTQITDSNNALVRHYEYDSLGNQITAQYDNGMVYQDNQWTAYGKPWIMTKCDAQGINSTEIAYNPEGKRIHRRDYQTQNAVLTQTHYVGSIYEQIDASNEQTVYRHNIADIAIYNLSADNTADLSFRHHDHIGSLVAESQTLLSAQDSFNRENITFYSFDAWGLPFKTKLSDGSEELLSENTTRGFTGHEMLERVELVHMNGRVYDPELGRFLSADPYIQAPANTQSFNRYAYVWNNPLSLTDPSGYVIQAYWVYQGLAFLTGGAAALALNNQAANDANQITQLPNNIPNDLPQASKNRGSNIIDTAIDALVTPIVENATDPYIYLGRHYIPNPYYGRPINDPVIESLSAPYLSESSFKPFEGGPDLDYKTDVQDTFAGERQITITSAQIVDDGLIRDANWDEGINEITGRFDPMTGELTIDYVTTNSPGQHIATKLTSLMIEAAGDVAELSGFIAADNKEILIKEKDIRETPAYKIRRRLGAKEIELNLDTFEITGKFK